jgi:hypothetical protein
MTLNPCRPSCILTQCIPLIEKDQRLPEAGKLRQDERFKPLRPRADFQKFLAELEKSPAGAR